MYGTKRSYKCPTLCDCQWALVTISLVGGRWKSVTVGGDGRSVYVMTLLNGPRPSWFLDLFIRKSQDNVHQIFINNNLKHYSTQQTWGATYYRSQSATAPTKSNRTLPQTPPIKTLSSVDCWVRTKFINFTEWCPHHLLNQVGLPVKSANVIGVYKQESALPRICVTHFSFYWGFLWCLLWGGAAAPSASLVPTVMV